MTELRISGWRPGMRKLSLTSLLRERLGLSLRDAKAAVDLVLEGREAHLHVPDEADCERLIAEIADLGAIAELKS